MWFVGCVTYAQKIVTLVENNGKQFKVIINYDGPYTGELVVEEGPDNERFVGRFTVVDRTSTQVTRGNIVVPKSNQLPSLGSVESSSGGKVEAEGFWFGTGNKGSTMQCHLTIGRGGHGYGDCKHSNGSEFKIYLTTVPTL